MYRGFNFDVLDGGFVFIWYHHELIGTAFNIESAKKRVDDVIAEELRNKRR